MTTSVGFDPEFFVTSRDTGNIIPICGLLGGTKGDCLSFPRAPEGFGYHEDNVVAELNVPPGADYYQAAENLTTGISLLTKHLSTLNLIPRFLNQHEFTRYQLSTKQAREFGCDPDLDAYTGGKHMRTDPPDFGNYRFAGGHIHLGGNFNCPAFVVALFADLMIGARCSITDDLERKKWYGQPGIYREKDYGVEYRTPGSSWLEYDDVRYDIAQRAFQLCNWLETTSALNIKRACDGIDWLVVREHILVGNDSGTLRRPINTVYKQARALGVPV